jgi:hypothetical protein
VERAAVSAVDALNSARSAGVDVSVDGDDLVLEAPVPPPPAVLALLSRHKARIVDLLRKDDGDWSAQDWLAFYDERAGFAEFDGELPRPEAEARAFACCIVEWMNRSPVISGPNHCVYCNGVDQAGHELLPFMAAITGHTWLHSRCWEAWFQERQGEAVAALAAMGLGPDYGSK